ncbi:hypothetical protein DPMN_008958 [Dreissena polymorpha]|uniref:Uncharacterized protein n=1 Tax=Dreissena polymorpha TaxID=45954 RepID=A0A9D4S066_DREPO|nr:hypothetical protein DPMN_008958 [Dreissena polymorpha]
MAQFRIPWRHHWDKSSDQDRTRNVASRVFTRKTAPPTGSHKNILTNFEINRGNIGTNLLTKFHEDRTKNVASMVFTNQMWTTDGQTDDGQRPITKAHPSNQVS